MTLNSKNLLAFAREFAARPSQEVNEHVDSLILRGTFADSREQMDWLQFCETPPEPFAAVQLYDLEIGGDVGPHDAFDANRTVQITIVKPEFDDVACFLFSTAAADYLEESQPLPKLVSAELDPRGAFRARGLEVGEWNLNEPIATPSQPIPVNPRKFVRDYVPEREISADLSPWIITQEPAVASCILSAWRRQSARRLIGALVNTAASEDGRVWLQAVGPPSFRIAIDNSAIETAWTELTVAVQWVFLEGLDVEVRHLLFSCELARATRAGLPLSEHLEQALQAAKAAYEAHIQSASRETLKALADLRKTVIDETQKVTQRAQDLTSGLWRDAAITATPFVIKAVGDASKSSPQLAIGLYVGAALFVTVAYALQWKVSGDYLADQRIARAAWLTTLYGHISSTERQSIAETPITNAETRYKQTRLWVTIVHALLVGLLVWAAISVGRQAHEPSSSSKSPAMPMTDKAPTKSQNQMNLPTAKGNIPRNSVNSKVDRLEAGAPSLEAEPVKIKGKP